MGGFGPTLGDARGAEHLRQAQKIGFQRNPQDDGGGAVGRSNYQLPKPEDLVLVEMVLEKLEGRIKERVSKEEAEAVARVCWENAEKTAKHFCQESGGDYPSTALRRLLQRAYRYVGKFADYEAVENVYDPQAAFYLLGSDMFHMARTATKQEVKKFFVECGELAKRLANCREPRRPTGRGLTIFLERVICFAERYAITKSSDKKRR